MAERGVLQIASRVPESSLVTKPNDRLLALPDLNDSEEAIDAWSNRVVYPRLRSRASRLEHHPVIGKLGKALDENGKFQISRLKPLIRQTVARIAALPPHVCYFCLGPTTFWTNTSNRGSPRSGSSQGSTLIMSMFGLS
jgi:hypothetical protein